MSEKTRFLHLFPHAEGYNNYLVAGVVWAGPCMPQWEDTLTFRNPDGHITVESSSYGESPFVWTYYKNVTEQFLFSHRGFADSVEEACAAALAYVPEVLTLEYLGFTFSLYGSRKPNGSINWEAYIDGDRCTFNGPFQHGTEPEYYGWDRCWSPGTEIFSFTRSSSFQGSNPTLRDAVIAAIDAPDLFSRACGRLIATLASPQGAEVVHGE